MLEPLVDRHHALTPVAGGHRREVPGVPGIAGDEVDEREREVLSHSLQLGIGVAAALDRPVPLGLRVVLQREAAREVGPRARVVAEGRKRARLHGRRRIEIRRQRILAARRSRVEAEQRRPGVQQAPRDALAHLQQVRGRRLQHEHLAEAHRGDRKLCAAQPEREIALSDGRFLEQVADLHDDLQRHARRERIREAHRLAGLAAAGDADQVVREELQVRGREALLVQRADDRVVQFVGVAPLGLELRDLQRLQQLDQRRKALPERRQRLFRAVERELVAVPLDLVCGHGRRRREETLRLQHRERPFDPRPALLAEAAARLDPGEDLVHPAEVEQRPLPPAERGLQRGRLQRIAGAHVVGAQYVREPHDQVTDALARTVCLLQLDAAPRVPDEALRALLVAVDEFPVHRERLAGPAEVPCQRLVPGSGQRRRRGIPQLRKGATLARGQAPADLPLQLQHPAAQPFVLDAGRGDPAQQFVHDARQRAHVVARRRVAAGEHQRKVVTQVLEVTVRGQQGRPHAGDRGLARRVRAPAGEMEYDLRPELLVHDYWGQTVNLSNSSSSVERIPSAVRRAPACLSSS